MAHTRVNVTLPVELAELVRTTMPGLNVSAVLQAALRERVGCDHRGLACSCCGAYVERRALEGSALEAFLRELMWQLAEPVGRCTTAEGAARVVIDVAKCWPVPNAETVPVPRATKRQRVAADRDLRPDVEIFTDAERPRRRARRAA